MEDVPLVSESLQEADAKLLTINQLKAKQRKELQALKDEWNQKLKKAKGSENKRQVKRELKDIYSKKGRALSTVNK